MEVKQEILQTIKHDKLKWYGHFLPMRPPDNLLKVIIDWSPYVKHRKGRPKYNWKNSIDETLKNYNLSKDTALNRER